MLYSTVIFNSKEWRYCFGKVLLIYLKRYENEYCRSYKFRWLKHNLYGETFNSFLTFLVDNLRVRTPSLRSEGLPIGQNHNFHLKACILNNFENILVIFNTVGVRISLSAIKTRISFKDTFEKNVGHQRTTFTRNKYFWAISCNIKLKKR